MTDAVLMSLTGSWKQQEQTEQWKAAASMHGWCQMRNTELEVNWSHSGNMRKWCSSRDRPAFILQVPGVAHICLDIFMLDLSNRAEELVLWLPAF